MLEWREYLARVYPLDEDESFLWDCGGMLFTGTERKPEQRVNTTEFDDVIDSRNFETADTTPVELATYDYGYIFTHGDGRDATFFADEEAVYHCKFASLETYMPSTDEYVVLEVLDDSNRKCVIEYDELDDLIAHQQLTPLTNLA